MEAFKISLFTFLGKILINFLMFSNRLEIRGKENAISAMKTGRPILFCCWHGRLVFASFGLSRFQKGLWAIASRHKDAEIMGRILKSWGYQLIRGSSNKGGKEVLRKMTKVFNSDTPYICITNDGPKGPKNIAKPGSLTIARKYNAQILTITGTSSKFIEMKSWDRFRLPKPFGKIIITISKPMDFPDEIKPGEGSQYLSDFMNNVQEKADKCFNS
ncbi:MAG: lysophospholipid acyltransferase family protein [Candidatus Marinimicrobia bacterium]|nr:lysophospholipid acyltransferase family protein [Candidatus Neomarinimicrobiota bacterium]